MGLKTIKMEWYLCSSAPCVLFCPNTVFQNPMSKTSCQKYRKTIITQKSTCHTKFLHSALQLAHPQSYMCRFSSLFKCFFPVKISFFIFCQGELSKQPKIAHFFIFTGKNDQINQTSVTTGLGHQMPVWGYVSQTDLT